MIPIVRTEIQGGADWLLLRQSMITATNISAIMGINPWATALALWEEKLGIRLPQKLNDKMAEGMALEVHARDYFNKQHQSDYEPVVLQHGEISYLMASLDGLNRKGEVLEIKCGKGSHELAKQGIVPEYYLSQLNCQMFCANVKTAIYFSYRSDDDNYLIVVERDDVFIDKMLIEVHKFYRMLLDFTPPPLSDKDFVKKDDYNWNEYATAWKQSKINLRKAEEQEEILRKELIARCDGQSCQGAGVRISKTVTKGRVDYSKIEALKDVDLEKYRGKSVELYRFTEIKN